MGVSVSSAAFRLRDARSGGAVHRLGAAQPLVPAPAAESAAAPARLSPATDAASCRDSRKNKKTAFAARTLPRKRSYGPGTRAEWSRSRALRRPFATAIE